MGRVVNVQRAAEPFTAFTLLDFNFNPKFHLALSARASRLQDHYNGPFLAMTSIEFVSAPSYPSQFID